ncbi:MAG: hypothetical protein R3F61_01830 [Myxococcota bacterium]
MLTFGPVTDITALTGHDAQIKALVRFLSGQDMSLEACLEELAMPVQHVGITSPDGRSWDFFGLADAALLFRAGTLEIVGHAIQHGFIASDRELWAALEALPPSAFADAGLTADLDLGMEPEEDIDPEAEFGWYESLVEGL